MAEIPFQIHNNHIYLQVKVGDAGPFPFIADTGLSTTLVNEDRAAEICGCSKGALLAKIKSKGIALDLQGLDLLPKSVTVTSLAELESFEGREVAGVLGGELFRKYVMEYDYAGKTLLAYDSGVYDFAGHVTTITFHTPKGSALALVNARISIPGQEPIDARLALSTGAQDAVVLFPAFAQKHGLPKPRDPSLATFDYSSGGEFSDTAIRLQTLQIGFGLKLEQPVAILSHATEHAEYDGIIGSEILRRFKVTMIYGNQEMLLERNAEFDDPFEYDMSGLALTVPDKEFHTFKVRHVIAKTPAEEAGIREQDMILAIDGRPAARFELEEIRRMFQEEGAHKLRLLRDGKELEVEIHLRPLL